MILTLAWYGSRPAFDARLVSHCQFLTVNRRAERFVPSAYPTTAHDTRVIAAAWLRVIGGDPAFQGDPGLLLEILEIESDNWRGSTHR